MPEVRRLLWAMLRPPLPTLVLLWAWSRWRRHHQAIARHHYKRRGAVLALIA